MSSENLPVWIFDHTSSQDMKHLLGGAVERVHWSGERRFGVRFFLSEEMLAVRGPGLVIVAPEPEPVTLQQMVAVCARDGLWLVTTSSEARLGGAEGAHLWRRSRAVVAQDRVFQEGLAAVVAAWREGEAPALDLLEPPLWPRAVLAVYLLLRGSQAGCVVSRESVNREAIITCWEVAQRVYRSYGGSLDAWSDAGLDAPCSGQLDLEEAVRVVAQVFPVADQASGGAGWVVPWASAELEQERQRLERAWSAPPASLEALVEATHALAAQGERGWGPAPLVEALLSEALKREALEQLGESLQRALGEAAASAELRAAVEAVEVGLQGAAGGLPEREVSELREVLAHLPRGARLP